jgi:uncharacterized protein YqeY
MLKQSIEQDLKTALLAGDKTRTNVLRSIKSAITYKEVELGVKGGVGLTEEEIVDTLIRESKKRQESADIFANNNQQLRADQELQEKIIIDHYLPAVISEEDLTVLVNRYIGEIENLSLKDTGQIISKVRQEGKGRVDSAVVARLVKERLQG